MHKSLKKNNKACPQCLKHSFCRRGFTLVETLVALAIFSVSLLGILSILASGIANTNYAKRKMMATYLAQEGIEYVRNLRDTEILYGNGNSIAKWNRFKNGPPIDYDVTTDPNFTGFSREVWIVDLGGEEVKIFSRVTWTQGSGPHSITFSENLFNW